MNLVGEELIMTRFVFYSPLDTPIALFLRDDWQYSSILKEGHVDRMFAILPREKASSIYFCTYTGPHCNLHTVHN